MQGIVSEIVKRFLILWFPFFMAASAFGQEPGSKEVVPPDEPPPPPSESAAPVNPVQNAVLEGIQISSEPGKKPGEIVNTCYFIFRDKPSSYFYEDKNQKLVFEFNDTQKGTSPIPSVKQAPIEGFDVEQKKFDANKEVKGLNPEYHDMISVTFNLSAMPIISVTDEYNVISFTYKWDPSNPVPYTKKKPPNGPLIGASIGGGVVLLGIAGYYIWTIIKGGGGEKVVDLDTTDLPSHKL